MKLNYFFFFLVFVSLVACKSEGDPIADLRTDSELDDQDEIVDVDKTFDENGDFDDPIKLKILQELNICGQSEEDSLTVPCSSKYFSILPLRSDKPIEDAFILKVRSMSMLKSDPAPFPERRVLVFERENGKLVRTNGFVGELEQFEGEKDNVRSPMIVFYDVEEDILFHCLFEWQDGRFIFKSVEGLDFGPGPKPIKASMKDSISAEVYTDLVAKSKIF